MGIITVFSIDGCPHCSRAKKALTERKIPYTEINLTSHPDKRSDMLSLSDSLTVPQIFFNENHIGGATETIALLEQWDLDIDSSALERFEHEIKSKPDPTDSRIQPSTEAPAKESVPPPRGEEDKIKIPNSQEGQSVLEITVRLMKAVPRFNLLHHCKAYKNATRGKNVTDALMNEFSLDREQAVGFGRYLQKRSILHHVTGDHIFSDTKDLYFRLQPHHTPGILNSFRVWTDRVDPDPMAMVSRLNKLMQGIQNRATDRNGDVDLAAASKDDGFIKFEEEVCELQGVDMSQLDTNMKTAFIINVYNLMIKHAQTKVGVPSTNLQRSAFFGAVQMNIGGDIFSFGELENGILRANATAPYALRKPFAADDQRLKLALDKVDPRIHFALNCGARSCPPVKKFTSNDLEEELRIVALSFCEQDDNIQIDPTRYEVHLNTIFKWYRPDFASSVNDIPKALVKFMRGERKDTLQKMVDGTHAITVKFNDYDWSSNVSNIKVFDGSILKADQYSIKSIFTG